MDDDDIDIQLARHRNESGLWPVSKSTPHDHDWHDLEELDGKHRSYLASYCRKCGDTQID